MSSLLEALLMSRLVKDAAKLPEIVCRSISFAFGKDISKQIQQDIADKIIKVPDDSTLSRARLKAAT